MRFNITHVLIISGPQQYLEETKPYHWLVFPIEDLPAGFVVKPTWGDAFLSYKDDGTVSTACSRHFFRQDVNGWTTWPEQKKESPAEHIRRLISTGEAPADTPMPKFPEYMGEPCIDPDTPFPSKIGGYTLEKADQHYALYGRERGMMSGDCHRISKGVLRGSDLLLWQLETAVVNGYGSPGESLLLMHTKYFASLDELIAHCTNKVMPARPPKRKPCVPESLTEKEVYKLAGIPIPV